MIANFSTARGTINNSIAAAKEALDEARGFKERAEESVRAADEEIAKRTAQVADFERAAAALDAAGV